MSTSSSSMPNTVRTQKALCCATGSVQVCQLTPAATLSQLTSEAAMREAAEGGSRQARYQEAPP
jgi:hypothetical protein